MLLADGFPFDPSTQRVTVDTIRIRLSEPQVETLSATGLIKLSDTQLTLIQPFYPKASKVQSVISATFNDSIEGLSDEDVHVLWVAAEEVAITLNVKVIANKHLRERALSEPVSSPHGDIRIAPNGQIYMKGKRVTIKEAFTLIASRSQSLEHHVTVCIAPPFHAAFSEYKDPAGQFEEADKLTQSVADTFKALARYGEALNVAVNKCW